MICMAHQRRTLDSLYFVYIRFHIYCEYMLVILSIIDIIIVIDIIYRVDIVNSIYMLISTTSRFLRNVDNVR